MSRCLPTEPEDRSFPLRIRLGSAGHLRTTCRVERGGGGLALSSRYVPIKCCAKRACFARRTQLSVNFIIQVLTCRPYPQDAEDVNNIPNHQADARTFTYGVVDNFVSSVSNWTGKRLTWYLQHTSRSLPAATSISISIACYSGKFRCRSGVGEFELHLPELAAVFGFGVRYQRRCVDISLISDTQGCLPAVAFSPSPCLRAICEIACFPVRLTATSGGTFSQRSARSFPQVRA